MDDVAGILIGKEPILNRLAIERFRGCRELNLTDGGQINLIVGRNDSGKTTLLEAIRFPLSADPRFLRRRERNPFERRRNSAQQNYRDAFFESRTDVPMIIRATLGKLEISCRTGITTDRNVSNLPYKFDVSVDLFSDDLDEDPERIMSLLRPNDELVVNIETNTGAFARIQYPLTSSATNLFRPQQTRSGEDFPTLPSLVWLGTDRAETWSHARRYSGIVRTGGEAILLEILKDIEPRLRSLIILTSEEDDKRGASSRPVLEVDLGLDNLLPLTSMGDGFCSIIAILSAVASAANGICLIDEVENGIHYSMLTKLWHSVADATQRYNSQMWATTHSLDCITAIHEALADRPDLLRVHRLDRKPDGTVKVHTFDHEMLGTALERGLEVR